MKLYWRLVFIIFIEILGYSSLSWSQSEMLNNQLWAPPDYSALNKSTIDYEKSPFSVPAELNDEVQFWIDIYSKYTTRQGVFHRLGRTDEVLGEIDLTDIYANQKWSKIRQEKEAELLIKRQRAHIAQMHGIKNVKQIRLQMGLKDRMLEAIQLSGLYLPMMEKVFQEENLPVELTRVVFVESSFNISAGSKVGASGLWQIMPRVAQQYKYIKPSQDLRSHPYFATRLAAKLFKLNYQILQSWPLAVTAYNHGVGGMQKLVRKYKSRDIGDLIGKAKGGRGSFGFASRNFYATFLAALHVEAHANLYFPEPILKKSSIGSRQVYLTKKMSYVKLLQLFEQDRSKLVLYNPHLKRSLLRSGQDIPASTLVSLPVGSELQTGLFREADAH